MGARNARRRHQIIQPVEDSLQNTFEMNERLVGSETQHIETLPLEEDVTPTVVSLLPRVLRTVQLDDQLGRQTGEVRNVRSQRVLAPEPHTQLPATQARPQAAFGIRHPTAKRPGIGAGG